METPNIKAGDKITIVSNGFFGATVTHLKVDREPTLQPYAQYKESLVVVGIPKGKRKPVGMRLYNDSQKWAIFEGWIEINQEPMVDMGDGSRRSRYASCDPRYFTDALAGIKQEPIFTYNVNND